MGCSPSSDTTINPTMSIVDIKQEVETNAVFSSLIASDVLAETIDYF